MRFEGIHHVAVLVSDYARSRAFYGETLGLPILRENYREDRGDWKLDLKAGEMELELFSAPQAPPRPDRPEALGLRHLAFRVDDIREAAAELEKKGIVCEPIRMDPYAQRPYTFFRDPDGLPLELHE